MEYVRTVRVFSSLLPSRLTFVPQTRSGKDFSPFVGIISAPKGFSLEDLLSQAVEAEQRDAAPSRSPTPPPGQDARLYMPARPPVSDQPIEGDKRAYHRKLRHRLRREALRRKQLTDPDYKFEASRIHRKHLSKLGVVKATWNPEDARVVKTGFIGLAGGKAEQGEHSIESILARGFKLIRWDGRCRWSLPHSCPTCSPCA